MKYWFQIFFYLTGLTLPAQQVSTFNGKPVEVDSTNNYSFIISGHFYGDGNNKTGYPANSLLANLDKINQSDACMLVCLGDLFMDIKNEIPKYKMSLFDKLRMPLFNAVGNHDLTDNIYQDNFGATFFRFRVGNDYHIILDTEKDNGDINADQLQLLKELEDLALKGTPGNVFVYGHRTVFKDAYAELDGLFETNTQGITTPNFETEVLPVLKNISATMNVYWFAGSLGDAPASFFHFRDEQHNITYIATAIRALMRDAILWVHVNNGNVTFETASLTGEVLEELEHYNVDFWQSTSASEPFNYRLIPYYFQQTLLSRYFWYGTAFAFLLIGSFSWLRRRRKRSTT